MYFVTNAQSKVIIKNGFGIHAGVTQFNIFTDNFETTASAGFIGGFAATADIPHKWYNVSFGLQFFQNNLEISGSRIINNLMTTNIAIQDIEYRLQGVQGTFLFHIKLAGPFLTFDIGPQLQFNGELEVNDDMPENLFLDNIGVLRAEDISDITRFNANGVAGFSGGIGPVRLRVHYTYGFTNILNRLNDADFNDGRTSFSGNQSIITASVLFTF